jgi:hypothetical protein
VHARLDAARAKLAAQADMTALAQLIGTGDDLRRSCSGLNLDRQAVIVRTLVDHVVIGPGEQGARSLDPDRVQVHWLP